MTPDHGTVSREPSVAYEEPAFGVDLRRCIGCHACSVACKTEHDVALGIRTIRALRQGKPLALPRFDKANDDRLPVAQWPRWEGPCDVVIFEGWCVGARPQRGHELDAPINGFERLEDPTGDWRYYVNRELGGQYQALFAEIDVLVMLRPESFEHVLAWREQQEAGLRTRGVGPRVMSSTEISRFVRHFERLTRFMWEEMPARADAVVVNSECTAAEVEDPAPLEVVVGAFHIRAHRGAADPGFPVEGVGDRVFAVDTALGWVVGGTSEGGAAVRLDGKHLG